MPSDYSDTAPVIIDGTSMGAFACFIVTAALGVAAAATVGRNGARARIIALWLFIAAPPLLTTGIVISVIKFEKEYNSYALLMAFSSSAGFVSMPSKSLASTGLAVAILALIAMIRWQRNDP